MSQRCKHGLAPTADGTIPLVAAMDEARKDPFVLSTLQALPVSVAASSTKRPGEESGQPPAKMPRVSAPPAPAGRGKGQAKSKKQRAPAAQTPSELA
eukprot:4922977-Amphidinium_carterae.1